MKHTLLIRNATVVLPDRLAEKTDLLAKDGKICAIGKDLAVTAEHIVDAEEGYLFPGFIDVHVHGGGDADFMDGTPEAFETAVKTHLSHGTTTLIPTALAASREELVQFIEAYHAFLRQSPYASCTPGFHLEGPYFSARDQKSRGAQKSDQLRGFDFEEIEDILQRANGKLLCWDASPELEGSDVFARLLREKGVVCSAGHSDATGFEAEAAFQAGFTHTTHFYNAMTTYKKRDQVVTAGVVEAAYLNEDVSLELILDGKHIPKHCFLLALKVKGPHRVMGITDASRLAASEQTEGWLGSRKNGARVIVEDDVAKLPDRTSFAGSTGTMDRALRVLCLDWGIDPVTAAKVLSETPAKHVGQSESIGSIQIGKRADLVLFDQSFVLKETFCDGLSYPAIG